MQGAAPARSNDVGRRCPAPLAAAATEVVTAPPPPAPAPAPAPAEAVAADMLSISISNTHDENVHGTSGAVAVEHPELKRATELRNIVFVTSEVRRDGAGFAQLALGCVTERNKRLAVDLQRARIPAPYDPSRLAVQRAALGAPVAQQHEEP